MKLTVSLSTTCNTNAEIQLNIRIRYPDVHDNICKESFFSIEKRESLLVTKDISLDEVELELF